MQSILAHRWILWGGGVLIAGGAAAFVLWMPASLPAAVVRTRAIEQHLVAIGRVWVPTRLQVSTQVPGRVITVGVAAGQRVHAGDLLVQLDDTEAHAAVSLASAAVEQANAKVSQLRRVGAIVTTQELNQAATAMQRASAELARNKVLFGSGAVSVAELDESQRAADIARAKKAVAEAQQWSATPAGTNSRLALTALMQAQAQREGAEARLTQTRVVSTHDATVLSGNVEPGEVVQSGESLLVVAVDAAPQLTLSPDERNLAFIAEGQRARASADAFPEQVFDAEVSYIAPSVDADKGSFEVRLRIPSPPAVLRPRHDGVG